MKKIKNVKVVEIYWGDKPSTAVDIVLKNIIDGSYTKERDVKVNHHTG